MLAWCARVGWATGWVGGGEGLTQYLMQWETGCICWSQVVVGVVTTLGDGSTLGGGSTLGVVVCLGVGFTL